MGYQTRYIGENFCLSNYLVQYFAPNGNWSKVATDFIRIYNPSRFNSSWAISMHAAAYAIRGNDEDPKYEKSLVYLAIADPSYQKNYSYFMKRLTEMRYPQGGGK